ncbi:cyclase family protein [Candidatus Dormiibacter inghamiae]|uniref:cyclase family protein n=1 Tax=Candidatus Dormiibacter inghamiae TaxID=3127013 RepID=UPI001A2DB5E3|nr:cyclase family protein [Candidatus Dormibacteraeota bacterium]
MDGCIIDLTVPVGAATKSPPSTDMRVEFERHRRGPGFWQVTSVRQSLHTGSHVDSGLHCYEDGGTTDGITLDQVCGEAVIFDLGELAPSTQITREMLRKFDPGVRPGQIAVVRTAWTDRAWGDFPRFFVESPYLAVEAAEFLASLQPKAVCFDFFEEYSARLPEFGSEDFRVHKAFLGKEIVIIEQATGLGQLVGKRFDFFAPFYKLVDVEGAPARIFAVVHD